MLKVAMISRASLFAVPGGDTVQVRETARALHAHGVSVDIRTGPDAFDYDAYDILHFFNLTRPSDILPHLARSGKPSVLSPVLVDYSEYDASQRGGIAERVCSVAGAAHTEYLKAVARWLRGTDRRPVAAYLAKGHANSIRYVLGRTKMLLPNSDAEMTRLRTSYAVSCPHIVVPNGIDTDLFSPLVNNVRNPSMVICVARIEGIKNQLNLIRALNNTHYQLVIIGAAAPNQQGYAEACRRIAAGNIVFTGRLTQQQIVAYYSRAAVHVLPSWFETTGLSSLEAAAMGCAVVVSDRGDVRDYFADKAFYCDPASPSSIRQAIDTAASGGASVALQQSVLTRFTWQQATIKTAEAYRTVLSI